MGLFLNHNLKTIKTIIAMIINLMPTRESEASPRKYTNAPQNIFQRVVATNEYAKNFLKEKWRMPADVEAKAARFGCQ